MEKRAVVAPGWTPAETDTEPLQKEGEAIASYDPAVLADLEQAHPTRRLQEKLEETLDPEVKR